MAGLGTWLACKRKGHLRSENTRTDLIHFRNRDDVYDIELTPEAGQRVGRVGSIPELAVGGWGSALHI